MIERWTYQDRALKARVDALQLCDNESPKPVWAEGLLGPPLDSGLSDRIVRTLGRAPVLTDWLLAPGDGTIRVVPDEVFRACYERVIAPPEPTPAEQVQKYVPGFRVAPGAAQEPQVLSQEATTLIRASMACETLSANHVRTRMLTMESLDGKVGIFAHTEESAALFRISVAGGPTLRIVAAADGTMEIGLFDRDSHPSCLTARVETLPKGDPSGEPVTQVSVFNRMTGDTMTMGSAAIFRMIKWLQWAMPPS